MRMSLARRLVAFCATWCLVLSVLLAALALVPTATLDLGPDGAVRFSLFPTVLTIFDTLLQTSLANSLMLAAAVALGSLFIGPGLGHILSCRRFWGRPLASALILATAVMPPPLLAFGLASLISRFDAEPSGAWPWLVWGWAASVQGIALVVMATRDALREVDPGWADAARLEGAGRFRRWWKFTRPVLRPPLARTALLIFTSTFADPATPLVLNRHRSVGFQLVASLMSANPFPRGAAIALLILLISLAAYIVSTRARRPFPGAASPGQLERIASRRKPISPGATLSALYQSTLAIWLVFAWAPVVGLLTGAFSSRSASAPQGDGSATVTVAGLIGRLADGPASGWLVQSACLGLAIATAAWLLARWVPCDPSGQGIARGRMLLERIASVAPPVVLGAGMLALGHSARLAGIWLDEGGATSRLGALLNEVGAWLDPISRPCLVLYLGVGLTVLPRRLLAWFDQPGRDVAARRGAEQARLAGARERRAWRVGLRGSRRLTAPRLFLWSVLGASNIAPAIVLSMSSQQWPLGPGVVSLASEPGAPRAQAATLSLLLIGLNVSALAWCVLSNRREDNPSLGPRDVA
jgi:ABC-type Fe3+ transport system permease subunit